jgi:hypothetical protein
VGRPASGRGTAGLAVPVLPAPPHARPAVCRKSGRSGRPTRLASRTRDRTSARWFPAAAVRPKRAHYTVASTAAPNSGWAVTKPRFAPFDRQPGESGQRNYRNEAPVRLYCRRNISCSRSSGIRRSLVISILHATHPDATNGLSSLADRRRHLRRQRRSSLRAIASGAGWGAVILLTLWLLLSGIFGFLSA